MSNPRGPEWEPTQTGYGYPPNTDPAYSGQYPTQYPGQPWRPDAYGQGYAQGYGAAPGYAGPGSQPTEQVAPYWQTGAVPPAPPPPPQPPKPPRWPWFAAGALVLLVSGLVLALVIVSSSSKEDTVVAPPQSRTSAPPRPATPTTPSRSPSRTIPMPAPAPVPAPSAAPPESEAPTDSETPAPPPAGSETVVYNVVGEGRAINITYVDTGGIMQTEFNVALPWSKEVSLPAPAKNSASVAVLNVGRDVTCTVTVNGAQIRQHTGQGLTICTGMA